MGGDDATARGAPQSRQAVSLGWFVLGHTSQFQPSAGRCHGLWLRRLDIGGAGKVFLFKQTSVECGLQQTHTEK